MLKELVKQHLISSKIILLFSIVVSIYTFYIVNNTIITSKYNVNSNNIEGYITNIKRDENKVTITLKNKEKVLVNYYENINLENGDYIKVEGTFKEPPKNRLFSLFNYHNYLLSQKIYWLVTASTITKIRNNNNIFYKLKNIIIDKIDSVGNPYIKTFILGDISDISKEAISSYQKNGTIHIFSVSGTHITLISFVLLKIFNVISKKENFNYIFVNIFLCFYLFLTSFSPPVLRSVLFFMLLTIKKMFKLRINTISILIFIFYLLLLFNPYYVYNLGFNFSFIITFYLILFQKLISQYNNYLIKSFIVSIIAFLASIPLMINNFFYISLLTPIFNIFFVPLVSMIVFPLSLITFIIPVLLPIFNVATTIMEELSILCSKINFFTIILKDVPFYIYLLYYLLITYVLYKMYKKKFKWILVLIMVILVHTNLNYFNKCPILTMIDVGQGDSTLISLPHNKGNILIDTGGIKNYFGESTYSIGINTTVPYLKANGIKKIDYLILSHGDYDHMGEAINIINNYTVKNIIFNSGSNNDLELELIKFLNNKKINYMFFNSNILEINGYTFKFLNGINKDENEDSLIIYTQFGNRNILLMGDAGISRESEILNTYNLGKIDILKVGHHGSITSSSDNFLKAIKPNIALISVGLDNRYNHPHKEVINRLNKYHSTIYRTSIDGSVKMIFSDKLEIYTCY